MPDQLLQIMENWNGYGAAARALSAQQTQRVGALVKLIVNEGGLTTRQRALALEEASGVPDFPLMFASVLNKELIPAYLDTPSVLGQATRRGRPLPDFSQATRHRVDGIDEPLNEVAESGPYTEQNPSEVQFTIQLKKYGNTFGLSWEAWLRDGADLGAFRDIGQRQARAARRTREFLIASQFVDANGPHASLVGTNVGNQAALAVTTLTIENLETALTELEAYSPAYNTDLPIANAGKFLAVGTPQRLNAQSILNSSTMQWTDGTGAGATAQRTNNVVAQQGLTLIVSPWINKIATSKPLTWMVVSDPNDIAAIETATLQGHENPELWMKSPNAVAAGGAAVSPFMGDFDRDEIMWRVRDAFAAAQRDVLGIWGSTGAGS
jgi:hypothetical protein